MSVRLTTTLAIAALIAVLFGVGFWAGFTATLARLEARGEAALTLAADRLTLQLDRYIALPGLLARDPDVVAALASPPGGNSDVAEAWSATLNTEFQAVADRTGALDIYLMDSAGLTIASSNWELERSFLGRNFAWRPYFRRAEGGALGLSHAVGTTSGERGVFLAAPVRGSGDAGVLGVVAVKISVAALERWWAGDRDPIFFTDAEGVVFLANRPDLVLGTIEAARGLAPQGSVDPRRYENIVLTPLEVEQTRLAGRSIWRGDMIGGTPLEAIWMTDPVPRLSLAAHVLIDIAPAWRQGLLTGMLAAAVGGVLALAGAIGALRRRALARQLATEARLTARLEQDVAARTAALSETNTQLRALQAQLVEAETLRALGEMSAGLAHELNQPLAAIRSLADNGEILLERARAEEARTNFTSIAQLSSRAGRIIDHLRAFARGGSTPTTQVDVTSVVMDALEFARPRIEEDEIDVVLDLDGPLWAEGGRVRLHLVVMNLIENALYAMRDRTVRRLQISGGVKGGRVWFAVADTGGGLPDPKKMFEPFYTTKPVGEGMGLGLSISYGIVKSFGGEITGETRSEGGARFEVVLAAALRQAA
ncbi:MAG: ATP-binding protein [Pseudomonadota bacterium]